jgi:hypothetical protein
MAIWARGRHGMHDLTGLIHHTDAGSSQPGFKAFRNTALLDQE